MTEIGYQAHLDVVIRETLSMDVQHCFNDALCGKEALVLASEVGKEQGTDQRALVCVRGGGLWWTSGLNGCCQQSCTASLLDAGVARWVVPEVTGPHDDVDDGRCDGGQPGEYGTWGLLCCLVEVDGRGGGRSLASSSMGLVWEIGACTTPQTLVVLKNQNSLHFCCLDIPTISLATMRALAQLGASLRRNAAASQRIGTQTLPRRNYAGTHCQCDVPSTLSCRNDTPARWLHDA